MAHPITTTIPAVTQEELRKRVKYEPTTGLFWSRRKWTGKPMGRIAYGYVVIRLDSRSYPAHRLAWLYVHGTWPEHQIDHINGRKADNRIENLRDVPQTINMQNQRKCYRNNRVGLAGVYWHRRQHRFYSQIRVNKKLHFLGYFDVAKEAHEAYINAKRALHPGNTV